MKHSPRIKAPSQYVITECLHVPDSPSQNLLNEFIQATLSLKVARSIIEKKKLQSEPIVHVLCKELLVITE